MSLITVVDYGMGNLRSVAKALEHVAGDKHRVIVSSDASDIEKADRVVFPGQGAARDCMHQLTSLNLDAAVLQAAKEKPFLGICMGMQVLLGHSEENNGTDCLGLYEGEVRYFGETLTDQNQHKLKIPHMGWNQVNWQQDHPIWQTIDQDSRFYFVHSYYADPADTDLVMARCQYGIDFVCAIGRDNVIAVQFHPEKSAADGLQLLKNFCQWNGEV